MKFKIAITLLTLSLISLNYTIVSAKSEMSEKVVMDYQKPGNWQTFTASWTFDENVWNRCIIDIPFADSLFVEFILFRKDSVDTLSFKRSDINGFVQRDAQYPCFPFDISTEGLDSMHIHLELKHYRKALFAVFLETEKSYLHRSNTMIIVFWSIFSAILVIILYNLFLFIGVLERIYLYYVIAEITVLLAQTSNYGFSFQYFWSDNYIMSKFSLNFFVFFSGLASIQFFIELLDTRRNYPLFDKVAPFVRIAYIIGLVPTFFV